MPAWTDDEEAILSKLYSERVPLSDITKALRQAGYKRSENAVRNRLHDMRGEKPVNVAGDFMERVARVVHTNPRPKKNLSAMELLDGFIETAEFRKDFSIGYRHVKCTIKTDKPIAIACISDVHIGSPYTDYASFKEDLSQILTDDRIYMLKGGDWADKFQPSFRDKAAVVNQVHPAQVQLLTIEKIMDALDGRIVAALAGNHDEMDMKDTGLSSEFWIHRGREFPYLPNGGLVELTVGSQVYRILWFHNRKTGNSQLNIYNVFRWLRELDVTADIAILEHEHNPGVDSHGVEDFDRKRTIVNIRTGTYKIGDSFSQKFYKDGRIGPQPVILFPDRRKIVPMHGAEGIWDARTYLNGLTK